jgi:hypothetical protein
VGVSPLLVLARLLAVAAVVLRVVLEGLLKGLSAVQMVESGGLTDAAPD